jgi:DNA-binding MarR family transcriptional regulator
MKYPRSVAKSSDEPDFLDELVAQWGAERPDLDLEAMETLGRLARFHALVLRSVEDVLAQHGLQLGEFDVLATLRRRGAPYAAKPSEIARALMLSPAGVTSRVDRLEALGLLERRPDPDDRRSVTVALTDAGRASIDAAITDHVANEARLLEALGPRDRATLNDLLRQAMAAFEPAAQP